MRYLLAVRLTAGDAGSRVVIRWRRPAGEAGEQIADVLGVLAAAGPASFTVRTASGELVSIPRDRALAGRTAPAATRRKHGELGGGAGQPPPAVRNKRSSPDPGSAE